MKQQRRKELKTNELSVYLQQIYDAIVKNANYIIGAIVVVVVILVIGMIVQNKRLAAQQEAVRTYDSIRAGNVNENPELIDQAANLAADFSDNPKLGPMVRQLWGDLCYQRAMDLFQPDQRDRQLELLRKAEEIYANLARDYRTRPEVAARGNMALATTRETLAALGAIDVEQARQIYETMSSDPSNPMQPVALARLENLDRRVQPIELVATRPAADTQPAASMQPPTTQSAAAVTIGAEESAADAATTEPVP